MALPLLLLRLIELISWLLWQWIIAYLTASRWPLDEGAHFAGDFVGANSSRVAHSREGREVRPALHAASVFLSSPFSSPVESVALQHESEC